MAAELESHGFAQTRGVLDAAELVALAPLFDELGSHPGKRDGLAQPALAEYAEVLAAHPTVQALVGEPAVCVRAILFNKRDGQVNWRVAPHRDRFVPLARRSSDSRLRAWSVKHGVLYAMAPAGELARMISLRVSLDSVRAESGGLEVWPGSHKDAAGAMEEGEEWSQAISAEVGLGPGDGLLFRPLLVHASRAAKGAGSRRTLHLEFGPASGCCGVAWNANWAC